MGKAPEKAVNASFLVLLTSINKPSNQTGFLGSIEASCPVLLVFVSIEASSQSFRQLYHMHYSLTIDHSFGGYDTVRDTVLVGPLQGNFLASFAIGWICTTISHPVIFWQKFICSILSISPRELLLYHHHPSTNCIQRV